MKKTRDEMLTDIIRKWGFENAATITFATLMDDPKISERALYEAYRGFMSLQALFLYWRADCARGSRLTATNLGSAFLT